MYVDSAILVKLLVQESDSVFFSRQLAGRPLLSSELAWTEVWSALLAKERAQEIAPDARLRAWRIFQRWVSEEQVEIVPLDSVTLRKANHILETCHPAVPLRTLDAIHTAACDLSQDFPLCSTDVRMREAARVLGIPVFPENIAEAR